MTDDERLLVAAATAHRACCGSEHDPSVGKLHGCCVVCGVSWPCDTASIFVDAARRPNVTDDEQRAWDLFAASALGALMAKNQTIYMEAERDSHNAADYADAMLSERRERTGAQGREQDISDSLLDKAIRFVATNTGDDADAVYCALRSIQRARAAGKGEG